MERLDFTADAMVESLVRFASSYCSAMGAGFYWLDRDRNIDGMVGHNIPVTIYADYLERINVADPLHVKRLIARADNVTTLDHASEGLDRDKVCRYRSFLGDYKMGDEVNFVFRRDHGRPVGVLVLVRREGDRPFAEDHYAWDLMHCHFEQALQNHARIRAMAAEDKLIERFGLTRRERQVLYLLADGLSNLEIAEAMGTSLATTKTHIVNILDKMGVNSRTAAVASALRLQVM